MTVRTGVIAAVAVVLASAACSIAGVDVTALRAALAVPALLLAPGYVLLAAAGLVQRLPLWERVVYTVAASLGLGVLVGVALGAVDEFTRDSVAVGFAVVTVVLARFALARRADVEPRAPAMRVGLGHAALFAVAGAIVAGAFVVAIVGVRDQDRKQRFPELSLVPPSSAGGDITVGVRNNDTHRAAYTLRVLAGHRALRSWHVDLGAGERFSARLPGAGGTRAGVRAVLIAPGGATVRHVGLSPATLASYGI